MNQRLRTLYILLGIGILMLCVGLVLLLVQSSEDEPEAVNTNRRSEEVKGKLSWSIFWALVGVFIVIASVLFIPTFRELLMGFRFFLFIIISGSIFFLLGVVLIFLTVKEKVRGILKKFLLLTGASAAGFFVSVFLHNAFYGLAIMTNHITVLSHSMEVLHVAFFIMAIVVCPIGFLVGVVGSIVLAIKKSRMVE